MSKKKKSMLSPAIAVLAMLIIAVFAVMCVLIVIYIFSDTKPFEAAETTSTTRLVTSEVTEETTAVTTTEPIVMTKVTTTTPDVLVTSETPEPIVVETATAATSADIEAEAEPAETTAALLHPINYTEEFFANDLFIGDSISTGYYLYECLPKDNVFAKVGLNPESALTEAIDGVTAEQKAAEMKPTRIYIMLGSNGLAFMGTTYMKNMMSKLIDTLAAASPDSKIVVLSIPPVTKTHDANEPEKMSDIEEYNGLLKEMSADKGVDFLNICAMLEGDDGYFSSSYAEQDGLHFLQVTYKTVLSYLEARYSE